MRIVQTTLRILITLAISVLGVFNQPGGSNVAVAAATGPAVIATISLGGSPDGVVVNPSTNRIYVTHEWGNTVTVIDGATNDVLTTVTVGNRPFYPGANPTTNRIYVPNYSSGTVSVIDGASNTVVATVNVGSMPCYIGVNPTTNRIYVSNYGSSNVSVIDGTTNTVVAAVPVGYGPVGVGVNPSTNRIYVGTTYNSVSVIDGASNTVVATQSVGGTPIGVGVNPSTNRVYVGNSNGNVAVIDGATNGVIGNASGGQGVVHVGVDASANRIYASSNHDGKVFVIDGATNGILGTVSTGTNPAGIDVNSGTGRTYVANTTSGTVSVIQDGMTAVSVSVSPLLTKLGQSSTVSGTIQPPSARTVNLRYTKPDGAFTSSTAMSNGAGNYSAPFSADVIGDWKVQASIDNNGNTTSSDQTNFTVVRNVRRVVLVFVRFQDDPSDGTSILTGEDLLNYERSMEAAVSRYYSSNLASMHIEGFNFTFKDNGAQRYQLDHQSAYYKKHWYSPILDRDFIGDSLAKVDPDTDFGQFDVAVVVSPSSQNPAGDGQAYYNPQPTKTNEKSINAISIFDTSDFSVICHELGHSIGLPDMYDGGPLYRHSIGDGKIWDLMGWNHSYGEVDPIPNPLSSVSRLYLGWTVPDLITVVKNDIVSYPVPNLTQVAAGQGMPVYVDDYPSLYDNAYIFEYRYGVNPPLSASGGIQVFKATRISQTPFRVNNVDAERPAKRARGRTDRKRGVAGGASKRIGGQANPCLRRF